MNLFFMLFDFLRCDYCAENVPNVQYYKKNSVGFIPQKVVLVIRHGDRTPEKTIEKGIIRKKWHGCVFTKNDNKKEIEGNYIKEVQSLRRKDKCKEGALTENGCNALYRLGKRLRIIYSFYNLLIRNKKDVKTRTTAIERTKASAICFLEGMFQETSFKFYHHPLKGDILIGSRDLITDSIKSKEIKNISKMFFKRMKREFPEYNEPFLIRDCYMASKCNRLNHGIESETRRKEERNITKLVNAYNMEIEKKLSKNKEYVKRSSGPFLKEIFFELKNTNCKMFFFSAHDTTVYLLLNGFQIKYNRWPGYNTNIIFERGLLNGKNVVRILLNGLICFFDWTEVDKDGFFLYSVFEKYIENLYN